MVHPDCETNVWGWELLKDRGDRLQTVMHHIDNLPLTVHHCVEQTRYVGQAEVHGCLAGVMVETLKLGALYMKSANGPLGGVISRSHSMKSGSILTFVRISVFHPCPHTPGGLLE